MKILCGRVGRMNRWASVTSFAAIAATLWPATASGAVADPAMTVPTHYRAIDLGNLGAPGSFPHALNEHGDVVGQASAATGHSHPFLWKDGVMTDLGLPPTANFGTATGINNRDEVVGYSTMDTPAGTVSRAFLWKDGAMTDLGSLGGSSTQATAINDRGQIVGFSDTADGQQHSFLWQRGHITDLGVGPAFSQATGINDRGQIVGFMAVGNSFDDFLLDDGTLTDLGPGINPAINDRGQIVIGAALWDHGTVVPLPSLTNNGAQALAIDNRGQAVGYSGFMSPKNPIPVLWQHGEVFNLAVRGLAGRAAFGINDRGEIIGVGSGQISDAVLYVPDN